MRFIDAFVDKLDLVALKFQIAENKAEVWPSFNPKVISKAHEKVRIPASVRIMERFGININLCPKCQTAKLETVQVIRYSFGENPELRNKALTTKYSA